MVSYLVFASNRTLVYFVMLFQPLAQDGLTHVLLFIHVVDLLTRSDGAVLFRSPPPGGVKKRKHRPEPLVIPPNVAAIQSRLRSPRTWEPGENSGYVFDVIP